MTRHSRAPTSTNPRAVATDSTSTGGAWSGIEPTGESSAEAVPIRTSRTSTPTDAADSPSDRILAHRPALAQDPPDDPDEQERERHRPAVAHERRRRHADDCLSERHEVVAGDDGGDARRASIDRRAARTRQTMARRWPSVSRTLPGGRRE